MSKSTAGLSVSRWPSSLGKIGSEYDDVATLQPRLIVWIRQSRDEDRRGRLITQFRRTHAHLERLTKRGLAPVFSGLSAKILDRFEQAGTVAVQVSELFHNAELATPFNYAMSSAWLRSAEAGIHFEADWAGAVKPQFYVPSHVQKELPSIDVGMSAGLQKSVREWLKARTEGVWSEVAKTIHTRLEGALKRGLRDGLTLDEMTNEIRKVMKGVEEYQASRIARTETTGGMNFGGQAERTDLGIEHKEWVSTIDSRTRGINLKDRYDHISTDGQTVLNADPFTVSGQKMLYPADGSQGATAGNICNCRCCSVGAWPKSPLKTTAPVTVPTEKPANWNEPKYEKATLPTSPKPLRPMPPRSASNAEFEQWRLLRSMDVEQRSQKTVDRINEVRTGLAHHNDVLETIRQRFLLNEERESQLEDKVKRTRATFDSLVKERGKIDNNLISNAALEHVAAVNARYSWLESRWTQTVNNFSTPQRASVAITGNQQLNSNIAKTAHEVGSKLGQILSNKHGLTVHIDVGDVAEKKMTRAFYFEGKYYVQDVSRLETHFHEIGHWIEDKGSPKVQELAKGFLHHRGRLELAKRIPNHPLKEIGIDDEFAKAFGARGSYAGKYYADGSEIISMGLQQLYENPGQFAKRDPEYFKFIVGIIRGDLL